ncbi:rCG41323 [Rattus norvegicus]|uniref:RCG41323 n=1 Tax=Rattus norvegicus TaxID=10116 RepID=A6IH08_RAT|nr:rCG41323 [Rattus norvegicus]
MVQHSAALPNNRGTLHCGAIISSSLFYTSVTHTISCRS